MDWTTESRNFRTFLLVGQLDPARISARVRQARHEAGLTQHELADLLGVHKRTVENYENQRVPWRAIGDLSRVFDRPVEWFLRGDEVAADDVSDARAALEEAAQEYRQLAEELRELVAELREQLNPPVRRVGRRSPRADAR